MLIEDQAPVDRIRQPAVFGYHEVFHLLVIAGVEAHFLAVSLFVLPTG